MSGRSSPTCILPVPGTAKQHSVVPPTNQSASSFSAWIQACRVASFALARVARSFSGPSDILLSTEQPESTPRVSYPTTQVSTDCRIDFAVVCRVVFKVFPRRLWVGGWVAEPFPIRSPHQQTVLASIDSSQLCKYPRARYLQVPSRHHGEVRVVAGPGLALNQSTSTTASRGLSGRPSTACRRGVDQRHPLVD